MATDSEQINSLVASTKPLDVDGVTAAIAGTACFALAFVVLLFFRSALEESGSTWWLWTFAVLAGFMLLMQGVYPTWIAPLFNRFQPLPDEALRIRVERLLQRCDAVLRIPGESRGADLDVARAQALGLPVYTQVDNLPNLA